MIGWVNSGRKSKHRLKQSVVFGIKCGAKKEVPELHVPAMQTVSEALKQSLPLAQKTAQNNTQNNSFNINVQASPNQDSKAVADEVMRRLKAQSRGAL